MAIESAQIIAESIEYLGGCIFAGLILNSLFK